jgi:hypothetical protein
LDTKLLVPAGNVGNPTKSSGFFKWLPHSVIKAFGAYYPAPLAAANSFSFVIMAFTPSYISCTSYASLLPSLLLFDISYI